MFSAADSDLVLDEIGDKVLAAIVRATNGARDDWAEVCTWRPDWVAEMFEREKAGIIHSRIWFRLQEQLEGVANVNMQTREPHRDLVVQTIGGRSYAFRVKRHSQTDRISSYSTRSDVAYWTGEGMPSFPGMELVNLAAGYRWDNEANAMGETVISYREGKQNVLWAYVLDEGQAGAEPITRRPLEPTLPQVDLRRAVDEVQQGGAP
ncbi:MAG: hypothetical protein NVV66_00170 [Cellulomonas sp.]|uniref:hypothetical protein n=1 Tax=Cellulomonas sp. TaxID=40001 RepID=UPI00258D44EF|nr:hypothetical protein [Cellulomonas sp.]MCR6703169.1 hypothetical protein [Cellulomonas sp.]